MAASSTRIRESRAAAGIAEAGAIGLLTAMPRLDRGTQYAGAS
jgi:hypothetical protein